MLGEHRFTTGEAVAVYALIGPAQVMGRIALLMLELVLTVMILLGLSEPGSLSVYVFAIAFGAGIGIKTIVQATAAPEFLGREGYGALQGAIMMPVYAAQAVSPFAATAIWQLIGGYHLLERVLLLCALAATCAFALAAILAPRRPAPRSRRYSKENRARPSGAGSERRDALVPGIADG